MSITYIDDLHAEVTKLKHELAVAKLYIAGLEKENCHQVNEILALMVALADSEDES